MPSSGRRHSTISCTTILGCRTRPLLARIIRELGDQILVSLSQNIGFDIGAAKPVCLKMLEQLFQNRIREAFLVVEVEILEDAPKTVAGVFDGVHGTRLFYEL